MDFDSQRLITLLQDIDRVRIEHELTSRLTGENFNVFKILGMSTAEVRTHSAFLAELLDPKGSHGQGTTYLDLFLKRFGISFDKFDPKGASVEVEKGIGMVDNALFTGGRIDIMLTDARNRHILIENKIYAGDQDNQMLRYHKYDTKAPLFYLTLDGKQPSPNSTCGKDLAASLKESGGSLTEISYENDILQWLDECHKASVSLPVVRETILQYENLIRSLTHQSTGDKVIEDAQKLIIANPALAEDVKLAWDALQDITWKTRDQFAQQMNASLPPQAHQLDNGITLTREWGEDSDGVWIGFRAIREQKSIPMDEAKGYAEILRGLEGASFGSNNHWNVGWFNPQPFGRRHKFENLPKTLIVSLHKSDTELKAFVDELSRYVEDVTGKLLAGIRTLK